MTLQAVSRRQAKVTLKRVGDTITIERPDGTEPRNKFHKQDDTDITYDEVSSSERAYIMDEMASQANTDGGREERHDTVIALAHDTDVREGDRLVFPDGRIYHADKLRDYDTYKTTTVTLDTE